MQKVKKITREKGIKKLGKLYFYDVALRIAAHLGNEWLPTNVYFHTGVLDGAKRLTKIPKQSIRKGYLTMDELLIAYPEFNGYQPWEIENILCFHNNYCKRAAESPLFG
jgi:hypothetical protein